MQQNHNFCYVLYTSRAACTKLETSKIRCGSLSNRAVCKDRAQNSSRGSPGSVLPRLGPVLGSSWAPLGWRLGSLGQLSGPLGRLLGGSWLLFGRLWVSFALSGTPLGRNLPPEDPPNLDFGTSGDLLGWFLKGLASCFLTSCVHASPWHIMILFVLYPRICIDLHSAFFPSGAAVCAQHMEFQ